MRDFTLVFYISYTIYTVFFDMLEMGVVKYVQSRSVPSKHNKILSL